MYETVMEGKLILSGRIFEGYIGITEGRIAKFSKGEIKGERYIKAGEHEIILPGMIDVHVHLRDFEQKSKETVESGTKAALHGGITTVFDMPNTRPPIMTPEVFKAREGIMRKKSYTDYALSFLIAGNCEEAQKVRPDFYKIFMGASTGGIYSQNFEDDYRCARGVVSVHAEDHELIQMLPGRPDIVEVEAIRRALNAAEFLKKPLNICHVSTKEGLRLILGKNLPWVSFEVTPHHLFLTEKDYEKNRHLKVYPPLRPKGDRDFLLSNLSRIPIIASDHAPHTVEDKESGSAGIPGLETELALLLDAYNRGIISISQIVEKTSLSPAKIFGVKNKGFEVGKDADLIIVNLREEWKVKPEDFYTKAKWSPWEGKKLKGKVKTTILRGNVVMEDDEVIGKPGGERIETEKGQAH